MKVLVCGGRDFSDQCLVDDVLGRLHRGRPIAHLIHGAAPGADTLANRWGTYAGVLVQAFPADWVKYGRSAGPIRNQKMLDQKPDLVVAFPGGAGTADMVRRARAAGVEVLEVGK